MKKQNKTTAGFTLIELIIVIVIMGILGGGGAVAYNGYVTAAHKGADRTTVGNLIRAASLADAADPNLFGEGDTAIIAITSEGTQTAGADGLAAALANSVGSLDGVKLAYGKWSGTISGDTLNRMYQSLSDDDIGLVDANGNWALTDAEGDSVYASYAGNADALWDEVTGLSTTAATFDPQNRSAGQLVAETARRTAEVSTDTLVSAWGTATLNSQALGTDDANMTLATQTARHYAFGEYLRSWAATNSLTADQRSEVEAAITLLQQKNASDVISPMLGNNVQYKNETVKLAWAAYTASDNGTSQAEADARSYYALMYNINGVSSGESKVYDPSDSDYLDNIGGYVSVAGTALSGDKGFQTAKSLNNSLANVNGGAVIITATKSSGKLSYTVSPADADPKGSDKRDDTAANAASISFTDPTVSFVAGNNSENNIIPSGFDSDSTLQYTAVSGDAGVCTVTGIIGDRISLHGVAAGTATITVTASDNSGHTATGTFEVTVTAPVELDEDSTITFTIKYTKPTNKWSVSISGGGRGPFTGGTVKTIVLAGYSNVTIDPDTLTANYISGSTTATTQITVAVTGGTLNGMQLTLPETGSAKVTINGVGGTKDFIITTKG